MSQLNTTPARTLNTHRQALHLLSWDSDEAGEQPDSDMVEAFDVTVDEENNSEAFWGALDTAHPEIASALRKGAVTLTPEQLAALTFLPGFEADEAPDHAPHPLLWTSCWASREEGAA